MENQHEHDLDQDGHTGRDPGCRRRGCGGEFRPRRAFATVRLPEPSFALDRAGRCGGRTRQMRAGADHPFGHGARRGHSLVALHFGEGDVAASVADIAETSGETLREAVLVLADGVVTQEEAVALEQRLHDLQRAVSHSLNVVRGIAHPEAASASVRRVS